MQRSLLFRLATRQSQSATGVQDNEAITLRWRDDEGIGELNASSLFTALEEQLELKFEATKGSVPVQLIDRGEKATEN